MTRTVTSRRSMLALLPVSALAAAVPITSAAQREREDKDDKVRQSRQSLTAFISQPDFVGTLTVRGFKVVNGALSSNIQVVGDVLGPSGNRIQTVNMLIDPPLAVAGSCEILTLTLGPLDLNLLGLTVHLNQVVLNITAVPGAGNLLGNLLCAVANLLGTGGSLGVPLLGQLTTLLNQILLVLGL